MITRRRFLGGTAAAAATLWAPRMAGAQVAAFQTPLPIPELWDARARGGALELVAAEGRHAFRPGGSAWTLGFSAPYLGPTLRVRRGDEVEIAVENRLPWETTCHWHGLQVPARVDGGPHIIIPPGETWRPTMRIDQPETTLWYHAHPHYDTGRQVYLGLGGMMIVEDGSGGRLGLPREYGVDDIPLILQDRLFDSSGALLYALRGHQRMTGMRGDTLLVNGVVAPVAKVPKGLARLRLLNAANARNFDLRFSDGRAFHVSASDAGYLPAPVRMNELTIAPSERFEILVDFSDGGTVDLETGADNRMLGGMGRGMMRMMAGSDAGTLMRFEVDASKRARTQEMPAELVDLPAPDPDRAIGTRRISLDMGPSMMRGGMGRGMRGGGMRGGPPLGINGRAYDMNRIDFEPRLGTTEIWEVTPNMMAHPFHVHGVIFRVLSIGGRPPAPHLAAGKDTILLDEPGELLMTFTQPVTRDYPFMVHCHILEHEDGGMMAQYGTVGA